jgi:hypothetical protein
MFVEGVVERDNSDKKNGLIGMLTTAPLVVLDLILYFEGQAMSENIVHQVGSTRAPQPPGGQPAAFTFAPIVFRGQF